MTRTARRVGVATLAMCLVAAGAGWLLERTRPGRVGPRFVDALLAQRPGTTVERWRDGVMRFALPSGVYIDVRLHALFDACAARRLDCTDAIDQALADVDFVDRATRTPRREDVRAIVVDEATPGYRYGFVTQPLVGPLEVRYALVRGTASTFVTNAVLDRLGLSQAQLQDVALAAIAGEHAVDLVRVDDAAAIWRVRSDDDPVASLLDGHRMKAFATRLRSPRLYAAVPARGALYLAAAEPATGRALVALLARLRGPDARSGDAGLLAYDTDAPQPSALSTATPP